jgi:phage baseplate assembly protein W
MAKLQKIYSDLDLTFNRMPVTNDIALSYDEQAVIRSVRNLLLTNYYEKPFQPNIGSNIDKLLFEPVNSLTAGLIADEIKTVVTNYESRVKIDNITVSPNLDGNSFTASVRFFIGNNTSPTAVNLFLQRSR